MRVLRRSLILILVVAGTALAGCGSSSHLGPSHVRSGHHISVIHSAICGYTAYRTVHDLRNGHHFAGAFNAYLAIHHCRRVRR
ncbi:MAG: hypothetical protein ACR2OB_07910 [Solirubrobacteraceae bacterium]